MTNRPGYNKTKGRPEKYGEPTKRVQFRCPASKVEEIKAVIKQILNN